MLFNQTTEVILNRFSMFLMMFFAERFLTTDTYNTTFLFFPQLICTSETIGVSKHGRIVARRSENGRIVVRRRENGRIIVRRHVNGTIIARRRENGSIVERRRENGRIVARSHGNENI
jgi:hypothetical protein